MPGLTIAKPTPEIIDSVRDFVYACEVMLERRGFSFTSTYEEWKTWDDDDDDKKLCLRIQKDISEEEGLSLDDVDGRIIAYEYLQRKYSNRLQYVVMTADVMIDNVCDPTGDCLDFHPGFDFLHVMPEQ